MKLYVFENVGEYSGGAAGAVADNPQDARKAIIEEMKRRGWSASCDTPIYLSQLEAITDGALGPEKDNGKRELLREFWVILCVYDINVTDDMTMVFIEYYG